MYKWYRSDSQVLYLASELELILFNTGLILKNAINPYKTLLGPLVIKPVGKSRLKRKFKLSRSHQKYQDHV